MADDHKDTPVLITKRSRGILFIKFADRRILDVQRIRDIGDELKTVLNEGDKACLLDFSHTEFLSTAVLNKLIAFKKLAEEYEIPLFLCSLRLEIQRALSLIRAGRSFKIYSNCEEVLAKLAEDSVAE